MKLNVVVILIFITGLFATPLTLSAAISAQMKLDKHMQSLAVHLKNKEYKAAAEIYTKTDKLLADHHLKVNRGYYFFKAEVMLHTNQITSAHKSLEKYLELTGRTGCYYDKAMQLLAVVKKTSEREREEEKHVVEENMVVAERKEVN